MKAPRQRCRECGRSIWSFATICGECVRAIEPPAESLRAFRRRAIEPKRDATPDEISAELTIMLEAIVAGELGATVRTIELARVELEQRRADVARRHGGGLAAGGGER